MRAVNLMPEGGRGGVSSPTALLNPAYGLLALLAIVLGLVTVYVLSSNNVSSRKTQLAALQQQVSQAQTQAGELNNYVAYQKLAQQRVSAVQQIASGRFDWHTALSNLSQVVPSDAAFQSLLATVSPSATVSGAGGSVGGGSGTSGLRGDIQSPAFEVKGCAGSHDDVARLLSRLRAMPGVQRVTLADSVENGPSSSGGGSTSSSDQTPSACGRNPANFDLVIFFDALPGAAATSATGATTAATTSATSTTSASSTAAATTASATTSTSTASAQPVSSGSSG